MGATVTLPSQGQLKGQALADNQLAFWNIPYAAPPVGNLRWQAPQSPVAWQGVRDATQPGPVCPQLTLQQGGLEPANIPQSEDCLTLNVWTTAQPNQKPLPVMVFIHGGSGVSGSGRNYNGAKLAANGVVVVTIDYRLGILGFMAHPELTAADTQHHSSGNYALLDQQAALRWVQQNIGLFGGDAHNVTLFGESAGSLYTCLQLVSPLAAGLFQHAIGESGSCIGTRTPLHTSDASQQSAENIGVSLAKQVNCDQAKSVVDCMRAMPSDQLVQATKGYNGLLALVTKKLGPNIDGYVLPEPAAKLFADGQYNKVDYITGTNENEATLFTFAISIKDEAGYQKALNNWAGQLGQNGVNSLLKLYPSSKYGSPKAAFNQLITDTFFLCPSRKQLQLMANYQPNLYFYHFNYASPRATQLGLGATHGSELSYVFGSAISIKQFNVAFENPALVKTLQTYWSQLAATGNPNSSANPNWQAYTAKDDQYLLLGSSVKLAPVADASQCNLLSSYIGNVDSIEN